MIKNAKDAGADNLTPSIPQYFSWINNTNEGSTECQTLINLEFFEYLKNKYGMQIEIYAWDAGNFDGARLGYGDVNSEKFRSQYPQGYKNVVDKAKSLGIKMGLWGSPDGFGDDEETERKRYDFFVHLCRDYNFGLFKLDSVCGKLRPEKSKLFSQMLTDCRKYVPSLIVLNHRLDLYEAEKNVTTYLWNGDETYTDVFAHNEITCMHHRGYLFSRGLTDNLDRLAEDHGVCISSCIDYFEDDLVYQAFGRSLILAPEIYGNPWLMRDDELPRLARVYNLHRRYRDILVNGLVLPTSYGPNAVSRGSDDVRIICTGNDSWETTTVKINIGKEIGITKGKKFAVTVLFPFVNRIGEYAIDETVEIELAPFRAALIEIAVSEKAHKVIEGKTYEPIVEAADGTPIEVIIKTEENTAKAPILLGSLKKCENDVNSQSLYEAAVFAGDNDSLEYRSLLRSGETKIKQVKECREAFFNQLTYKLRGCENRNLFDGREDTFFDSQSKTYNSENMRIKGGCLRIDFNENIYADEIEIDAFFTDKETNEVLFNTYPDLASYSNDLKQWKMSKKAKITATKEKEETVIRFSVHDTYTLNGNIKTISYPINDNIRYFRLPLPPDRIYNVRVKNNGEYINLKEPKANNLFAPFEQFNVKNVMSGIVSLPKCIKNGAYLSVAIEGECGEENAYVAFEVNGKLIGCPDRAPSYKSNVWEHVVTDVNGYYTYYLPLDGFKGNEQIKVFTVFGDNGKECKVNVYYCEK